MLEPTTWDPLEGTTWRGPLELYLWGTSGEDSLESSLFRGSSLGDSSKLIPCRGPHCWGPNVAEPLRGTQFTGRPVGDRWSDTLEGNHWRGPSRRYPLQGPPGRDPV